MKHIIATIRKRALIRRGLMIVLVVAFGSTVTSSSVFGFSQQDLNSIVGQTPFYDPTSLGTPSQLACLPTTTVSTGTDTPTTTGGAPDNSVWSSNAQPPYYVEQFVVQVLEDIASKENVATSQAVTQEHVIALIAWAWEEGGDLTNSDLFNLWNTDYNAPGFLSTAPNAGGVQSYASFDYGVEAAARAMTLPQYSRLGAALTDPSTTAEQFMYILTYDQNYPNNTWWAQADTNDPANNWSQTTYYNGLISVLQSTRSNYASEASTEVGVADAAQVGANVPTSELVYGGGSSNTIPTGQPGTGTDTCSTTTSSSTSTIVQTALSLAWPTPPEDATPPRDPDYPTTAYTQAVNQYNPSESGANSEDCGVFVATVMHMSGADPNYPTVGTTAQAEYVLSHPNLYQVMYSVSSTSQLEPGDILIVNQGSYVDPTTGQYVVGDG